MLTIYFIELIVKTCNLDINFSLDSVISVISKRQVIKFSKEDFFPFNFLLSDTL